MLNLMLEGYIQATHYEYSRLLGQRYYRLDPVLPERVPTDNPAAMVGLKRYAAEPNVQPAVEWLRVHFD